MTTPQPHRVPGPDSAQVPPQPLARSPAEIPAPPPRHATPPAGFRPTPPHGQPPTPPPPQYGLSLGQLRHPYGQPPYYGQFPPYGQPPQQYGQPPQRSAPSPHYRQPVHHRLYPPPPHHGQPLRYGQPPEHLGHPQSGADLPLDDAPPRSELSGLQREGGARPLAGFPARAISFLIDTVAPCSVLIAVLIFIGAVVGNPLMILAVSAFGTLGLVAFVIWNSCYQQGVTGQSIGRRVAKTELVHLETGAPVGFGTALLRQICHGAEFGIGYLWPLWDERRQTFADKIVGTLVVHVED